MAERRVRALRDRVQLIPNMEGLNDKSASEPATPTEMEALAQMALLSGAPANNQAVSSFLKAVSNTTLTASIQQYER